MIVSRTKSTVEKFRYMTYWEVTKRSSVKRSIKYLSTLDRKTSDVFLSFIFCRAPPTALRPNTHYERIIEAFGGKGYFAETPEELNTALTIAFEETKKVKKPVLINVMISPYADRKPQVHER